MRTKLFLFLLIFFSCPFVFSQTNDSAKNDFLQKIKIAEQQELEKSIADLAQHRAEIKRTRVLDNMLKVGQRAKAFLKNGIDSIGIQKNLAQIIEWNNIVQDGIYRDTGPLQTQRNLSLSSKLNKELLFKVEQLNIELDNYLNELVNFRDYLDSLKSDSSLYNFPKDTAGLIQYTNRLKTIVGVIDPIDFNLQKAILSLENLENKLVIQKNQLMLEYDELQDQRKLLFVNSFRKEFSGVVGWSIHDIPFKQTLHFSFLKEKLALIFYFQDNLPLVIFILLAVFVLAYFIWMLKRKVTGDQLVFRFPLLSSMLIVFNLLQFTFLDPPFIFYLWFWLISTIALTIIFWKFISRFWIKFWLSILLLFVLASFDNLILLSSHTERVYIFFLSISGLLVGVYFLFKWKKYSHELKEKYIKYFLLFLMGMQLASVILNIYGSYNLSKSIMVAGYFGVLIGILLLWTIRLINDLLFYASEAYTNQNRKLFYINFQKIGTSVPSFFYVLLLLGWFVLVSRNFYLYKEISEPFSDWMFEERTIGEYTFSFRGIINFIVIILISFFASRVVSFLTSEPGQFSDHLNKPKNGGIGSWILLVRIAIISMGLFFAFAAAGIPIDKITIILGALSVGIGFGLQTLINNLVSGLILAFEKPVNVGDIVEVMGKSGTMKSIGFRSSVITTWEGANLIISNGDLMNAQLINWTQNNGYRRLDLTLSVVPGSDLNKVQQLIAAIVNEHQAILKTPKHQTEYQQIENGSIRLVIYFWVKHFADAGHVMSQLIVDIDRVFQENKIDFSFPTHKIIVDKLTRKDDL